ncbi:MAG: aminotransferase class III-fold pyridoxal phosphate-dependent enzyme, partial [Acidobacteriales bacterium]|nr:aminotransferase class III-fold pyridoxal phosphate-dependent enzyme [Terriglobales bacterium]
SIAYGSGAFLHGYTYSSHPISMAAGRAVLQLMQQDHLVEAADSDNAESAGGQMKQALQGLSGMDVVGDVRGKGLLWGVEFVAEKRSKFPFPAELNFAGRVGQAAVKRGVLVYPMQGCVDGTSGDHILIAPPAVITADEIAWATAQLRESIEEAVSEVAQ